MTDPLLRRLGVAATIGAWLFLLVREIMPAVGKVTEGFAAYYTAAYAILHGGAADLNNNALFAAWLPRAGITLGEVYQGNTPTLGLLMIPLTPFSPAVAQTIWLVINVILLIACTWLTGKMVAPENVTAQCWIAAVFAMLAPVRETLRYGQVYLLIALLFLLTVHSLINHKRGAGIWIALIALLKAYYGVLALLPLIWSRRYIALRGVILTILLVVIIAFPLIGSAWAGYFPAQLGADGIAWASVPANQTLHSFFLRLFSADPVWNPQPLADVPALAFILRYITLIMLVVITMIRAIRSHKLWLWLPALVLMPILAPIGEPHHYTIMLLPIAVTVTRLINFFGAKVDQTGPLIAGPIRRPQMIIMVAALIFLITPYPSLRDAAIWQGWLGLFAYPRLIGALLLWAAV